VFNRAEAAPDIRLRLSSVRMLAACVVTMSSVFCDNFDIIQLQGAEVEKHEFFYANAVATGYTDHDFMLILQRRGLQGEPVITVNQPIKTEILARVDVAMSPGHMKALVGNVLESLMAFEKQHGKINLTSAEQTIYDAAVAKFRTY
jgi:hypothetical protein